MVCSVRARATLPFVPRFWGAVGKPKAACGVCWWRGSPEAPPTPVATGYSSALLVSLTSNPSSVCLSLTHSHSHSPTKLCLSLTRSPGSPHTKPQVVIPCARPARRCCSHTPALCVTASLRVSRRPESVACGGGGRPTGRSDRSGRPPSRSSFSPRVSLWPAPVPHPGLVGGSPSQPTVRPHL